MEIRVLGPFEIVNDDGQLMDVGGPLPQALLVALALAEGHLVPADQLLDQVWPGEGLGDRNRLQVHISRLRKMLGSDLILTRAGGYSLKIPAGALDAARFDQLTADGRAALQRQDAAEAGRLLRQALSLWRGRPLAEFADAGFAPGMITRLEEARLAATEDRIEAKLMLGGHGELTGELEALVQEHPLRERLWGQLIVALYRSGRQGDALGAYQRARAVLSLALPQPATGRRVRALAAAELVALAQGRDDALAYGERAVELGRAAGDRPALALAVWLHGSALAGVFGEHQRAIGLLEESGALLEAEADDWSLGMAALTRGVAALARPDPGQAQVPLRGAADWFAQAGNVLPEGAALRHLADLAVLRGRYDDAISSLEEMLSILPAEDHPAGIIRMAQLGCLQAFQGRPGQSCRWHARAEAAADGQQHVHLRVFACNARGLTLRRLGRLGEAGQCHVRALELCRGRNVPEGLAMAHASLGYIAELRDDADTAEQHHRASLHAACAVADRQAQALGLEGLAGAATLRGDASATGRLLGAASAFREGTVGTVMGQGTAMRETIIGRLLATERNDTGRAAARFAGQAAFDAAYAEGLRDPLAVLSAARA